MLTPAGIERFRQLEPTLLPANDERRRAINILACWMDRVQQEGGDQSDTEWQERTFGWLVSAIEMELDWFLHHGANPPPTCLHGWDVRGENNEATDCPICAPYTEETPDAPV